MSSDDRLFVRENLVHVLAHFFEQRTDWLQVRACLFSNSDHSPRQKQISTNLCSVIGDELKPSQYFPFLWNRQCLSMGVCLSEALVQFALGVIDKPNDALALIQHEFDDRVATIKAMSRCTLTAA